MRKAAVTVLTVLICGIICSSVRAELPELLASFRADSLGTLLGKRIIPLGDQNGDGFADILVAEGADNFAHRLKFYYGGNPSTSEFAFQIIEAQSWASPVGDIDGDGSIDFVANGRDPGDWKLKLFYGGAALDTVADVSFGLDTLTASGYTVNGHDINSDGVNELIASISYDPTTQATDECLLLFDLEPVIDSLPDLVMYPANKRFPDYLGFGEGIAAGDYNGDGKIDLAANVRYSWDDSTSGNVYLYWGGPEFDTVPDMIISRPGEYIEGAYKFGWVLEHLGDVSGDGYDDFLAGSGVSYDDRINYVYFGGPDMDDIPDIILDKDLTVARAAGDVNNDGNADFITGYPLPMGDAGWVMIYYGGPDLDSIPDLVIYGSDMPQLQYEFGLDVSGVGDFNGDGIDDFALTAIESTSWGTVYIFSGSGAGTDVPYEYEPMVPDDFTLSQNYPNPFNPSTTIEFSLPYCTNMSLTIHNILGEKVRTLIDKNLPAGTYTIEWNGKRANGSTCASGTYLYRLRTDEGSLSRKMVLVK